MKKSEKEKTIPDEKVDGRKGNSGRKSIFKDDESGKMFWLSLPISEYDNLAEKFRKLREPFLK